MRQKITPFLWFDDQAEDAMHFYLSIFKDSRVLGVHRSGDGGRTLVASFELDGLRFTALNGGPQFRFNEAVSFVIDCESQEEVDYYWNALIRDGGEPSMCGWLKDKFGLSWQVVPRALVEMLGDSDPEKSGRVMQAMLQMSKIDISALQGAYDHA